MSSPGQKTAIVDKLLTNVSKAFVPTGFIAELILPKIRVKQSSGLLGGYGEDHLRIVNNVMGGRGKAPRYNSIVRSSEGYKIENHGLEGIVTKDDFDNVEQPFDARKDETLGLKTVMSISREKALSDVLGDTSVITQNVTLTGTDQWSDFANSDPIDDFKTAQNTVYDGCGMPPDSAIISWKVANTLKYHPAILENLGFTQNRAGTLTEIELAKAMSVRRLLIGVPQFNSAAQGQTPVRTPIWADNAVFMVTPQTAQKYQVSLGYTIRKSNETMGQTFRFALNNPPMAEGIIVTDNYDDLLSNVTCAFLIKDAIA